MTGRTVLLLIGLFCCWSAEAPAQTVDTSAAGALIEQASSVTEPVATASQELEPVTNQVSPTGSTTPPATDSAPDSSGGTSSSGGASSAEECEETRLTKNGGSEEGGAAGGRASGGGPTPNGGPSASRAGSRDRALAARRERARGDGVLKDVAEGGTPAAAAHPEPAERVPFWAGLAVLIVLVLGFAGFVAALTSHLLTGRGRDSGEGTAADRRTYRVRTAAVSPASRATSVGFVPTRTP